MYRASFSSSNPEAGVRFSSESQPGASSRAQELRTRLLRADGSLPIESRKIIFAGLKHLAEELEFETWVQSFEGASQMDAESAQQLGDKFSSILEDACQATARSDP